MKNASCDSAICHDITITANLPQRATSPVLPMMLDLPSFRGSMEVGVELYSEAGGARGRENAWPRIQCTYIGQVSGVVLVTTPLFGNHGQTVEPPRLDSPAPGTVPTFVALHAPPPPPLNVEGKQQCRATNTVENASGEMENSDAPIMHIHLSLQRLGTDTSTTQHAVVRVRF